MSISREQVEWVADLARLELTEEEPKQMTAQLGTILDYIAQLQQIDTSEVEPLVHPMPLQNVFRDDKPADSLPADAALANAPDRHENFFSVPSVLGHTGDE